MLRNMYPPMCGLLLMSRSHSTVAVRDLSLLLSLFGGASDVEIGACGGDCLGQLPSGGDDLVGCKG